MSEQDLTGRQTPATQPQAATHGEPTQSRVHGALRGREMSEQLQILAPGGGTPSTGLDQPIQGGIAPGSIVSPGGAAPGAAANRPLAPPGVPEPGGMTTRPEAGASGAQAVALAQPGQSLKQTRRGQPPVLAAPGPAAATSGQVSGGASPNQIGSTAPGQAATTAAGRTVGHPMGLPAAPARGQRTPAAPIRPPAVSGRKPAQDAATLGASAGMATPGAKNTQSAAAGVAVPAAQSQRATVLAAEAPQLSRPASGFVVAAPKGATGGAGVSPPAQAAAKRGAVIDPLRGPGTGHVGPVAGRAPNG